jgi:hypothetical protein
MGRRQPEEPGDYEERGRSLQILGYASYSDYLRSPLWGSIRSKVIARSPFCRLCRVRLSTQAHHTSYCLPIMGGQRIASIWALCGRCHLRVEFTCDGDKRSFLWALKRAKKLDKWAKKFKRNLRPKLPLVGVMAKAVDLGPRLAPTSLLSRDMRPRLAPTERTA